MMRLPRFVHRAYAALAGYFWLPCPLCGHGFGGHERSSGDVGGWVVCDRHHEDPEVRP